MSSELGTGDYMQLASSTFGMAWHAGRAGNWELSAYYLRRTRGLFRRLRGVKPKYEAQLDAFESECLEPLLAACAGRDLPRFEAAYTEAVSVANGFHVTTGHEYIRWEAPERPPDPGVALEP